MIVRQNKRGKDHRTMNIDESDEDDGECPICLSTILQADVFQARPCNHCYHVNCIDERQWQCLVTMDGIVGCAKCGCEINNLSSFKTMKPTEMASD